MAWVALLISLLALCFTVVSFWWLHARPGRLRTWEPRSYIAAATQGDGETLHLRLPLVLYNDGATPIDVEQLRVAMAPEVAEDPTFALQAIHPTLYGTNDERQFATGFSVPGRTTLERTFEFQRARCAPVHQDDQGDYSFTLYGKVFGERRLLRRWPDTRWVSLLDFTLTGVVWSSRLIPRDNRTADEPGA